MVENLISPLGGSADMDDEKSLKWVRIDGNNKVEVKKIILDEIKPFYDSRSEEHKNSMKRSLSYFLTANQVDFGELYDSCLIAFDHPKNARDFFLWIWETLFPIEDFSITDISNYIEMDDINESGRYY